jgi:hypothetical protein
MFFSVFPPSFPLPLYAPSLSRRLAAVADAFPSMVNTGLLLPLLTFEFTSAFACMIGRT